MSYQLYAAPNFYRPATTTASGWVCFRAFQMTHHRPRGRGPRMAMIVRALDRAAKARGAL